MDMTDDAFDRFDPMDDEDPIGMSVLDSQSFVDRMNGLTIWKVIVVFLVTLVIILLTASIVCGTNDQCRNHIPTIQNMLNSHLASPFVVTAVNMMQFVHMTLALAVFYMCRDKARYWSILQLLSASLFHMTLLLTLFLVTFLGWDRNWTNVASIVTWIFWMLLVMKCLKKYHKYRIQRIEVTLLKYNWIALLFFFISTIVYVVFRALSPTRLDFQGKDTAVLVAEIIGGISTMGFIVLLIYHIRKVTFNMYAPK